MPIKTAEERLEEAIQLAIKNVGIGSACPFCVQHDPNFRELAGRGMRAGDAYACSPAFLRLNSWYHLELTPGGRHKYQQVGCRNASHQAYLARLLGRSPMTASEAAQWLENNVKE